DLHPAGDPDDPPRGVAAAGARCDRPLGREPHPNHDRRDPRRGCPRARRGALTGTDMTFSAADLLPILPILIPAVGALVLILVGAIGGERASGLVNGLAVLVLVGSLVALALLPDHPKPVLHGAYIFDAFSRFLQVLVV